MTSFTCRLRRLVGLAASSILLLAANGVIAPAAATAASLPTFAAVLDDNHDQVFVSSGLDRSSVRVLSLSGGPTTVIDGLWGATGLALSPDNSRLYVSLSSADAIAVIDTASLTELTRIDTGVGSCPVELTGGTDRLWFLDHCVDSSSGWQLRGVDLSGPSPVISAGGPVLAVGSTLLAIGSGNVLVLNGGAPGATVYDGAALTVLRTLFDTEHLTDVAVDRPATTLYATGEQPGIRVVSLADFSVTSTLGTAVGGRLSVSPDGLHIALYENAAVEVRSTTGELKRAIGQLYNLPITLMRNTDLVLGDYSDNLRIIRRATSHVSTLAWQPAPAPRVDQSFTLTAHLSSDLAIAPGSTVHLTRTAGTSTTPLPDAVTDSAGSISVTDVRPLPGTYVYRATYEGDINHDQAVSALSVKVAPLVPAVTVTVAATKVPYHGTTTLTLHIPSDLTNRRVIVLQRGSVVRDVTLDAAGSLTLQTLPMALKTALEVRTGADARYAASSTTRYVLVGHNVIETLVDGYKTAGTDAYYHAGAAARLSVRVPDSFPLTADIEIGVLASGVWKTYSIRRNVSIGYTPNLIAYTGPRTRGTVARIRLTVHATEQHLQTTGPWRVLHFTA